MFSPGILAGCATKRRCFPARMPGLNILDICICSTHHSSLITFAMPDLPVSSRRRPQLPPHAATRSACDYAELHCKTNFSFLQGAAHPDELVLRAAELGYAALAITDANSLAGVVRAHGAAKQLGLKLLIGAEIAPLDAAPLVLW